LNFQSFRNGAILCVWITFGIISYGVVWIAMTQGDDRSYLAINTLNQKLDQEHQNLQKDRLRRKPVEKEKQEQQKQSNQEHRWAAAGLWITVLVLSYHRIKTEGQRRRGNRNHRSDSNERNYRQHALLQSRRTHREVFVRTLRRINQERQAQNQDLISTDAMEAFQEVLQDREFWMGLQRQQLTRGRARQGATPEQLQTCPHRDSTNEDEGVCSICLIDLHQEGQPMTLRTLPCNHSFHSACIDRWFETSTYCPICKSPL
jgi:hypothetical protein